MLGQTTLAQVTPVPWYVPPEDWQAVCVTTVHTPPKPQQAPVGSGHAPHELITASRSVTSARQLPLGSGAMSPSGRGGPGTPQVLITFSRSVTLTALSLL